jgi:hypothetical protein
MMFPRSYIYKTESARYEDGGSVQSCNACNNTLSHHLQTFMRLNSQGYDLSHFYGWSLENRE